MAAFTISFRPNTVSTYKPTRFTAKQFQIGGIGSTRGFHVWGFKPQENPFVPQQLASTSYFNLTFPQKITRLTGGRPVENPGDIEKILDKIGPVFVQALESGTKYAIGLPSIPEFTGSLTAAKQRHSSLNLLGAFVWGKGQLKNPEGVVSRWFSVTDYTLIRPAIISGILAGLPCAPTFSVSLAGALVLNEIFARMHRFAEDFFDPPANDGAIPPPPPPPPDGEPFSLGSNGDSGSGNSGSSGGFPPPNSDESIDLKSMVVHKHGQGFGNGSQGGFGETNYKQFPPRWNDIRDGLRVLGMTYAGATRLLMGQPVNGQDAVVFRWILAMVQIQCLRCNLLWVVPEQSLPMYVLHFPYRDTNIAWCPNCKGMTHVRISGVGGVWAS